MKRKNSMPAPRRFTYGQSRVTKVENMSAEALSALEQAGCSRRGFLAGAGVLLVGFASGVTLTQQPAAAQSASGPPYPAIPLTQVDSWIAVGADGSVTGFTGKCDFGQGFGTVQYQLVAEEMNVALERVSLFICDTAITPDQGVSSGSQGHPTNFGPAGLRQALATAMNALMRMASQQMSVPVDQLLAENGMIMMRSDRSRRVSYASLLAGKKFAMTVDSAVAFKHPRDYKVLGKSIPRYDIPQKVTGEFEYVHNIRLPGMLHGRVVRPPVVDAKVASVDENSVRGLAGNPRVVVKGDFVGVVADTQWAAIQAAENLTVNWTMPAATLPAQATLYDYMLRQPTRDNYIVRAADVDDNLKSAARVVSATYKHPYQLHGSMGTSCAVADAYGTGTTGIATIWSATQGVYPQRDSVARVLGIPNTNVRVIQVEGSGCYGINGADSVSYDAAILSQAVGRPVRVQYSRRDELIGADHFGPAYVINLKAGVDAGGTITAWDYEAWTLSKGGRPNANNPGNIPAGALAGFPTAPVVPNTTPTVAATFSNNSNAAPAYGSGCVGTACGSTGTVKSERVLVHTMQSPFFTGPLRSPNRLQNSFANECFMDEVAAALRVDPVQYRLKHLADPRMIDALNGAAKAANWDTRPSPKPGNARTGVVAGRGIAVLLYEGDNGYSAVYAEVEVNQETGVVIVKRFVVSQDSGPISNPDGLKNQMEGGTLQGMSRALYEEVRWNDRSITSIDWRTYPVYQFGMFNPKVDCVLIDRPNDEQMGAGEGSITIVAAALGNAIFDATGARIREVPFTPARVLAALRERA
ncbi:MAG: xanthine dehydrogenase family protein molybdopterin-binding subunit [Bryobacterales bacterium]|nr:xanthine dehydrogenase family protein molybdopterin-binding subunit [Bryobacterales bacterium]